MRKLLLALALLLAPSLAFAQNTTCQTRQNGDSSNACASTAFVQQAIATGAVPTTASNTSLKAIANPTTGQTIIRQGFTTPNDGGAGIYVFNSTCPGTPDNGQYVSPTIGSGCWVLEVLGPIDAHVWGAKCDGATQDQVALNSALAGGVPSAYVTGTCIVNAAVNIASGVSFFGASPSATIQRPTVNQVATGPASVASNLIPMTNTTGLVTGMFVSNRTNGFNLPGTISSINPGVSITMSTAVGNSGSQATSASTAAGSAVLTFATPPNANAAQAGMFVYDVTQARLLPGTIATTTTTTTITMSANVGGSGVGSGDTLTFGYPVNTSDVLVFATYNGLLFTLNTKSTIHDLSFNEGNFDTGNSGGTIGATNVTDWVIDRVNIQFGGRYCFVYTQAARHRISNSTCQTGFPSNKNNNEGILGFCSGGLPAGIAGKILNNVFDGYGNNNCEQNILFSGNTIRNFKYGAGITCDSSSISAFFNIVGNDIYGSSGQDSNLTWVEGIECWSPTTAITGNTIHSNGGAGIAFGGNGMTISGNDVWDNGQSTPSAGIACVNQGGSAWQNGSQSIVAGNTSRNIFGSTQTYGYQDTAACTAMTFGVNNFSGTTGAALTLGPQNFNPGGIGTSASVSACGTSPSMVGTTYAGQVIVGTGAPASCLVTFNVTLTTAPFCVVSAQGGAVALASTASTTGLTVAPNGANVFLYNCAQYTR